MMKKKVRIKDNIDWRLDNMYHEKYYICPVCEKLLAYDNGIKLMFGTKSENFCSNCGCALDWTEQEKPTVESAPVIRSGPEFSIEVEGDFFNHCTSIKECKRMI